MTLAHRERIALAQLCRTLGPDAPTLCEGWTTRDLVVHLLVRSHRPDAAAGMVVDALKPHLDTVSAEYAARDYEDLVEEFATPARRFLQPIDTAVNTVEHFVHHEDVRRAQPGVGPRELNAEDTASLWRRATPLMKMLLRSSKNPVVLVPEGAARVVCAAGLGVAKHGDRVATVTGPVGEIVLWAFGREVAEVNVTDPYDGVRRGSI